MKRCLTLALGMMFLGNIYADSDVKYLNFEEKLIDGVEHDKSIDPEEFRIASVEVKEVEDLGKKEGGIVLPPGTGGPGIGAGIGDIIMMGERLLAFGRSIYDIIENGKPVVNTSFATAVAILPNIDGTDAPWYVMENWSAPTHKKYTVNFKNKFGKKVISFTYRVQYQHSGQYKGAGKYLSGISVSASNVTVGWGYKFDANSSLISISNRSTVQDPLAAATIQVNYTVKTLTTETSASEIFHITGEGELFKQ